MAASGISSTTSSDVTIEGTLTVDGATTITGALTQTGAVAAAGALAVATADNLTVGGVIVPQTILVQHHAQAAAEMVDQVFAGPFLDDYTVVGIEFVHAVAETTAANLRVQVTKDNGTEAPGAGNNLLTNNTNAGFDCKATANTVQNGTLTATGADLQLTAGDRLSVDYEAAATELVGVNISVQLQRR